MPGGADSELAVRNVLARLAHLADDGDTTAYVALLTEDVVWRMPANDAIGLPATERRGRDEIAVGQRDRIASGVQGPGSNTMHVVTTVSVEFESDDTAVARSQFQYWGDTTTHPVIKNVGRYDDVLRRDEGDWRLASRTIRFG